MKVSVLGCGRWGSCIAWYLDKIGHEVLSGGLENAPEFIQLKEKMHKLHIQLLKRYLITIVFSYFLYKVRFILYISSSSACVG